MGSHVACLRRRRKANGELQRSLTSSEMLTQSTAGGEMLSKHRLLLQQHHEVLKQMIDPKGFLLMELLSRDVMDDRDRQWIKAEKRDMEMNARLISWLMENDSNTFAVFLESLRACHQEHIANLLEGREGSRILTKDELQHITAIEPLLSILLDTRVGLVDMLYSCGAISKTDYQRIFVRSTDYQINKKLLKVLMRSSDTSWMFFFEGLRETKQSHLLEYFDRGSVITAKVEMSPRSCRHVIRERVIMDQINDVTRHLHLAPVSQYIEDNQLVSRLVQMSIKCVCIHVESYIVFYFYCPSSSALSELWLLYYSGQLQSLVYDLFNVKSLDAQHMQFKVNITKADYKACRKQLESSEQNSLMSLCEISSSKTSQPTSIQKISASVLDLVLLKAAARRIQMASPLVAQTAKTYIDLSSVCSTWRTAVSERHFVQRLQVLVKT